MFDRGRWVQRECEIYAVRPYRGSVVKRTARRRQACDLASDSPGVTPECGRSARRQSVRWCESRRD